MKTAFSKFALAANKDRHIGLSLLVATVFMFGCSDEGSDEPPYKPSSVLSSSSARQSSSSAKPSSSSARSSSSAASSSSVSSSSAIAIIYGETVIYHGEEYPTVVIGEQTWFAKNLNYEVEGSICYRELSSNCNKYGRLYSWATAMELPIICDRAVCSEQIDTPHKGICPSGWHIPSNEDWKELENYDLKAKTGWETYSCDGRSRQCDGNGKDTYGFAALPGGWILRSYEGGTSWNETYLSMGYNREHGAWWTSTPYYISGTVHTGASSAIFRTMGSSYVGLGWNWIDKPSMMSIRCIKD